MHPDQCNMRKSGLLLDDESCGNSQLGGPWSSDKPIGSPAFTCFVVAEIHRKGWENYNLATTVLIDSIGWAHYNYSD